MIERERKVSSLAVKRERLVSGRVIRFPSGDWESIERHAHIGFNRHKTMAGIIVRLLSGTYSAARDRAEEILFLPSTPRDISEPVEESENRRSDMNDRSRERDAERERCAAFYFTISSASALFFPKIER